MHVETNITQKPQAQQKTKPNPMRAHAYTILTTYIVFYLQNTCLLINNILNWYGNYGIKRCFSYMYVLL